MYYLAQTTSHLGRAVTAVYKNLSGDILSSRILDEGTEPRTAGFALRNKRITFNLTKFSCTAKKTRPKHVRKETAYRACLLFTS